MPNGRRFTLAMLLAMFVYLSIGVPLSVAGITNPALHFALGLACAVTVLSLTSPWWDR